MIHLSHSWLPGCENIALFGKCPWLAWSPRLGKNTPNSELFSKKKFMCASTTYFIKLFLAKTLKINQESLCSFEKKRSISGRICRRTRSCSHVRTLMTRKSYAVGMRSAIVRNHLKRYTMVKQRSLYKEIWFVVTDNTTLPLTEMFRKMYYVAHVSCLKHELS